MSQSKVYQNAVNSIIVFRARITLFAATVLYVGFTVLDHVVYPEMVGPFLINRIVVSSFFLLGIVLSYLKFFRRRIIWIVDFTMLSVGFGICLMVYMTGGATSEYFQGLNLVLLAMLVMNTFYLGHNIVTGLIILASYLVAIWESDIGAHASEVVAAYFWMATTLFFVGLLTKLYTVQHRSEFSKRQEIAIANKKLIEAERMKSEFFANVSHELRTPLTLILAPLESMLANEYGPLVKEQARLLTTIKNNALRMLQMVNGLLDFSKLEAGRTVVKREPTDMVALTQSILEDFIPLMKKERIIYHFEGGRSKIISEMDRYLYERILFNLLSNAVKFTPAGGSISISLLAEGDQLQLTVKDSGIGIGEDEVKNLFQKFHQVEGSSTRRFEGTGLGLALTKEFATLLGGKISVTSEKGRGSEFKVGLLAPAVDEAQATIAPLEVRRDAQSEADFMTGNDAAITAASDSHEEKMHILVCEDNKELASYIVSLLSAFCKTHVVENGVEALKWLQSHRPDLILSDVMMPEKDGLTLCREVKENPDTNRIPVVLLTALTHREALLKGWEAGADEYLFKPFHPRELVTRIRSLLGTVQQKRRAELYEHERNIAMENAVEGVVQVDKEGNYVHVNAAYSNLLGFSAQDLIGQPWGREIHSNDKNQVEEAKKRMFQEGKSEIQVKGIRKDGSSFKMRLAMVKTDPNETEEDGWFAFVRDITEEHYQEALAVKTELISMISHEMRTPLHIMKQALLVLEQGSSGEVQEKQKNVISIIDQNFERMSRLVNNVLDLQKLDSGVFTLQVSEQDVNELILHAKKNAEFSLFQKKVTLEAQLEEGLPRVKIDKDRVIQVLTNLIDNAIKFTEQGTILIRSEKLDDSICISVQDSGIGIQETDISRLFRDFGQLEEGKLQAPTKGTGLGLAITKKIVELHEGKIWVRSEHKKGSVFSFTLPTQR